MYAATTSNTDICLIVAVVLFGIAAVVRVARDAFDGALVAAGLAVLTLAFLIAP